MAGTGVESGSVCCQVNVSPRWQRGFRYTTSLQVSQTRSHRGGAHPKRQWIFPVHISFKSASVTMSTRKEKGKESNLNRIQNLYCLLIT